ncbi:hypothetical protein GCM10009730_62600 [Streptomyces albidochromogenes]
MAPRPALDRGGLADFLDPFGDDRADVKRFAAAPAREKHTPVLRRPESVWLAWSDGWRARPA